MPARLPNKPFASRADVAACRAALRGGSRTFFAASLVLPKSVRKPATGLYAFCRMADDAIDTGTDRIAALAELRVRLDRIYDGDPCTVAADRAFADCVMRYAIPKAYPLALLEGFEWDSYDRRYANLPELTAYAVRVAGTVGAMMAMVMGVRGAALIARACDLGVAMQFSNIARDVGEDARCGRLYLPQDWLREQGIDPQAWLAGPAFTSGLRRVIERLLDAAEALYARADVAIAQLPAACRPGMYAARLLYAEIGHEVARNGFDSVSARAVVPWQRKARILASAADAAVAARRGASVPMGETLPEAAFLLRALPSTAAPTAFAPAESQRERERWPKIEDRVVWLINLFDRLERQEQSDVPTASVS